MGLPGRLLNIFRSFALMLACSFAAGADSARAACASDQVAVTLGVSRTVEIDATSGPVFGSMTRQGHEPSFLKPKEVVLTFDDGPMPWVTKSILDTLDANCTKATFFSVGRMALAYPATVKDVLGRGHTLGTHTYSHPFNMPRMKLDAATSEIERGFAAVSMAANAPVAPFFRFTGLSDSARLVTYLQTRNIATFTVDVVTNDSYIHDPVLLADRTMSEIARKKGGIILFHDIKTTTAKALPVILQRLKADGYTVVHLTSKAPAVPMADAMRDVAPKLARLQNGEPGGSTRLPFYGAIGPDRAATSTRPRLDVTSVAPSPRERAAATVKPTASAPIASEARSTGLFKTTIEEVSAPPVFVDADTELASQSGWVTSVKSAAKAK
jgi:peptidoglycan-N-acetylglucosamine deacetylase